MTIIQNIIAITLAKIFFCFSAGQQAENTIASTIRQVEIRAIYGSPNGFWNKNIHLGQLNVNAVFLNWKGINEKILNRAAEEGLKVFAEFPLLNGKGYVDKYPEAWPVDQNGNKADPASWFMGVCPTDPGFRQFRMMELRELLRKHNGIDGVWLDYVHWHAQFEEPEPILPETCFCKSCIRYFEASTGIDVPEKNTKEQAQWILSGYDKIWREWRCSVIAGWVRDARIIINQENPDALLGIFHCPWSDDEFNGARYRILGLDFNMLKEFTDVFSPMVYHGRMGRSPEWVKENIEWFCNNLDIVPGLFPKAWPIVQAYDDPYKITAQEFETVLHNGCSSCSSGIMMFTSNSVSESAEKTETMKRVYAEWISGDYVNRNYR